MSGPALSDADELVGEVTEVVFRNEANGFGVVELLTTEGERHRASGPLAALLPGQPVRLRGSWVEHDRYGPTFAALFFEPAPPSSIGGLKAFLASEHFPGVGEKIAERLVERFGLGLPEVVMTAPERLAGVRGVSPVLATRVGECWRAAGELAELVQRLAVAGIGAATAAAVHRRFGDGAVALLEDNPWALLEVRGVTWTQVEALARALGLPLDDERRMIAGAVVAQRRNAARGGHMAVGEEELAVDVAALLRVGSQAARGAIEAARRAGRLVAEWHADERWWYLPADRAAEQGLADELARLHGARSRVGTEAAEYEADPLLTDEQASAVRAALTQAVSLLTGGPGTGKTRTVVEVVRACEEADLRVALCAPTGRAAKRLEELTLHPATTVHRLLEARPTSEGGFVFSHGPGRRLPHDLVVADEWSMADTRLAHALTAAVDDGAHLLLVGDSDQLPSVGAGAVLRDLQAQELGAVVSTTRLETIHRQAAQSRIVTLAHEVNAGAPPVVRGVDGDVFAVVEQPGRVADRVAEIVAVRAPEYFDCPSSDVQVLAPMYRGHAGVNRLNERLKERLNPAVGRPALGGFHEGDRVVQTRNDAALDVANGDIGEVIATDVREGELQVAFPQGLVTYQRADIGDLTPAWCLTVHKAQGGEWPVVVLVLDASHRALLWRELVYTAITRAARGLLLVGDPRLLVTAAAREGSGARLRRTLLVERLRVAGDLPGAAAPARVAESPAG
ncbi:MAG: SF1B family DNA helicase RecD2 [Egibacteraceae bacterium]